MYGRNIFKKIPVATHENENPMYSNVLSVENSTMISLVSDSKSDGAVDPQRSRFRY